MTRVGMLFIIEVWIVSALFFLILGGVIWSFETVESFQVLFDGKISSTGWLWATLQPIPFLAAVLSPVLVTLAATLITLRWKRRNMLMGIQLVGRSLAVVGGCLMLASLSVGGGTLLVRDLWAELEGEHSLDGRAWMHVSAPKDREGEAILLFADRILGGTAESVRLAWLKNGALAGTGRAREVRFEDGVWSVSGLQAHILPGHLDQLSEEGLIGWGPPTQSAGPTASTRQLWGSALSPARTAWLMERPMLLLSGVGWSWFGFLLVLRRGAAGVALSVGGAVLWSGFLNAMFGMVSRGVWGTVPAMLVCSCLLLVFLFHSSGRLRDASDVYV